MVNEQTTELAKTPPEKIGDLYSMLDELIYSNTISVATGDEKITDESDFGEKHHMEYRFRACKSGRSHALDPIHFDTLHRIHESGGEIDLRMIENAPDYTVGHYIKKSIEGLLPLGLVRRNQQDPAIIELSDLANKIKYSAELVKYK